MRAQPENKEWSMSGTFRLGAFVVGGLLLFALGIFWIGKSEMLFQPKFRLNAEFANVAGLQGGAEVRVAGIRKGTVARIDLPRRPGQKVRVEMDLSAETRRVLKSDSSAAIHTEGLMGDEFVEISMGSEQGSPLKDNATLPGTPPLQMSDLVGKASGILDTAGGAMQNVNQAADNLSAITAKVNNGTGTVGALVNDNKIYQNMSQASSEMKDDMEAVKHNFLLSHFFHERGYEDTSDLTKHQIARLPAVAPAKSFSWSGEKIFDKTDTAKLKDNGALKPAGVFLQSNPFGLAVVVGYADMKGDEATEKILTEARAMVVRDFLVKNFKMDDTNVRTLGLGKSPDAGNSGISVLIYPPGTAVPNSPPTLATSQPTENAKSVHRP
jgi:phospholipid/cholesterol/gamma-HCH transport system substrate-binding protein